MGYAINIIHPDTGNVIEIDEPHHIIGSTYQLGGSTELHLCITYNYSPFYYRKETLGESTEACRDMGTYMETVVPEKGGIPGLAYCTIPEARERLTHAINALRDEHLDKDGNQYEPVDTFDGDKIRASSYWAPTERNARNALKNLLSLLLLAPDNAKIEVA